jgi:hypothetical protein
MLHPKVDVWLAHHCGALQGQCNLRSDFPPVTAGLIVPTFTRNAKMSQTPDE